MDTGNKTLIGVMKACNHLEVFRVQDGKWYKHKLEQLAFQHEINRGHEKKLDIESRLSQVERKNNKVVPKKGQQSRNKRLEDYSTDENC
ncbi:unnamed protein product [Caretta caretta]